MKNAKIKITGIVQGVGFRPFVFRCAKIFNLNGTVLNGTNGVKIEFEGKEKNIIEAIEYIKTNLTSGAKIENFEFEWKELIGYKSFEIIESVEEDISNISVSPDLGICDECINEMDDKNSRFYKYPFTSCTSCGPRFSILEDIPYDRPFTSMIDFKMCEKCKKEYENPIDRRYHAQTISCSKCGPKLWCNNSEKPIDYVIDRLKEGKIVAIKGIGGYHLACDAKNDKSVELLRQRKNRQHKPFAIMMKDINEVEKHCFISDFEKKTLLSIESPIVLLKQKINSTISKIVNPNVDTLGVMIPYTPIHKLIFEKIDALVMTSGNISSEPIITDENNAENKLINIADEFIHNNRRIINGCDDSVVRCLNNKIIIIRKSRGFVASSINISKNGPDILACGSDLKNTFCIYTKEKAYVSQHIGDLLSKNTFDWYRENIEKFNKLLKTNFKYVVCDFHPEYQSTKFAQKLEIPLIKVQHHHAHITSVMGENNLFENVIGVSFDGTGYGDDGNLWGGEFFVASRKDYKRIYHFENLKMPGGEIAVKEPWRMGTSLLYNAFGELPDVEFIRNINIDNLNIVKMAIDNNINCPQTSSVGRLFDAISAILGIRDTVTYEGQAAIEFEAICDNNVDEYYSYEIINDVISTKLLTKEIVKDIENGIKREVISAKFHNTIVKIVVDVCCKIREKSDINKVALGGGVFQNINILRKCINKLIENNFEVYTNKSIPCNDGGISFGQVVVALEKIK